MCYPVQDSVTDDASEKVVDIYQDSVADENDGGCQTQRSKISL